MSVEEMIKTIEYFSDFTDEMYEELENQLEPIYKRLNDLNNRLDCLFEQLKDKERIDLEEHDIDFEDLPFPY